MLRPDQLAQYVDLQRHQCSADIEHWVEGYWQLRWTIPPGQSFLSQVLPHPAVSLTVELGDTRHGIGDESVVVTGVPTRRFDVQVQGHATVFGIKFRPGGFAAMFATPAHTLRDRVVPASELVPRNLSEALAAFDPGLQLAEWTARADRLLAASIPAPDADFELLLKVVQRMLHDRSLLRVADVEQRVGVGRRRLQRLFSYYVGVSPKCVLSRYRMHDVVAALDNGYQGLLTDLAATYGWYDQAHFIREFSALIGTTPSAYRDGR